MKKEFETPEIDVMMFNVVDVITTSFDDGDQGGEGTGDEGKPGEGEFPIG